MSFLTTAALMDKYGPLLTEEQLAQVLHSEPTTLRNQRSSGVIKIPTVRHGRTPLFHAEDVAKWIDEQRGV